jgi:hypothetical protein
MGLHGQCSKRVGEMKAGVDAQARNNSVGTRLRRARSLPHRVRRDSLHWGVTVHTVTETDCSVYSCCYFLWKKVTKELAESERALQSPPHMP